MNDDLLAAIENHETLADSFGSVSEDRSKALDRYLGNPYGNEVEGRSQVVSRDVWDTVEWIKPQLADVFVGGDQVVSFAPKGPEDVKAAEQETEFINHVITEKNQWFTIWYNWTHDALLQKDGYVIAYWDDARDRTKEEYEGKTEDEAALILQDPTIKVTKLEQNKDGTWELEVEREEGYACAKIENVPPERVLVSHNARGLSLQDPRLDFVEYWEYKTLSDLRDEGFKVDDDLSDHSSNTQDWEEDTRDDNNPFRSNQGDEASPAAKRLKVRNVWIRYDSNDDGLTELRRVVVVGSTILSDEECDEVTLYALCPTPLPHQHTGLSMADAVMDLQQIKTALLRGSLDNVYLANNGRHAINDNVNLDDMLVSRPGGIVRVRGGNNPMDSIGPLTHTTTGQVAVPIMEYVDRIAQKRTGISETMQGLNGNSLNNSLGAGTNMAMVSAAQQRIKFLARIFAETGIKALFRGVHALTLKHARKPEIVQLRNQWVEVDPRTWRKRSDLTISVGLGAGDKNAQLMFLEKLLQIQATAMQANLSSPNKIYNTLKRLTVAAGYKDPNEFWDDPATTPPKPQQPPIELQKIQAQAMADGQLEAARIQKEVQLKREEFALKMQELQANLQLQQSNDMRDAEREQLRAQFDAQLKQEQIRLDQWKAELQAQMDKYTNDQDNATKLVIADKQQAQQQSTQALQIGHDAMQKDAERGQQMKMQEQQQKPQKEAKAATDQFTKAIQQLADMQRQIVDGQKALEKAVTAKRVLVRDASGKPTHSEVQQ
jgi:hypothetical protein